MSISKVFHPPSHTKTAVPQSRRTAWGITAVLVLLTAGGSAYLMARSRGIECDTLAPLTVLATLAAFLISVCFRQMGRYPGRRSRWFLVACLVVAGATLFTDFRYVRRNRGFCNELHQQMQSPPTSP